MEDDEDTWEEALGFLEAAGPGANMQARSRLPFLCPTYDLNGPLPLTPPPSHMFTPNTLPRRWVTIVFGSSTSSRSFWKANSITIPVLQGRSLLWGLRSLPLLLAPEVALTRFVTEVDERKF